MGKDRAMRRSGWRAVGGIWLTAWMLALALWRPSLAHNDEAHVVWAIRTHDLPELIATEIRLDGQPPLYPILLWLIQQAPGFRTIPMLYFASLLLAFPLHPIAFRLARALGGPRTAIALALLLAFNPLVLGWALFLRAYGLTLTLTAWTLWLAVRADRRPTPGRALAWGLSGLLLLLTFYPGAFAVAACALWLLRRPRERARWAAAFLGGGIPGLAIGIMASAALSQAIAIVIRHQGNPGIRPGPAAMTLNFWLTLWSGWAADARWALAVGTLLALGIGAMIAAGWRRVAAIRFPILAFAIPFAGFLIGGWRYNFFAARYAVVAIPPLLLGIAHLAAQTRPRFRAAFLGMAGLMGLIGLSRTMMAYAQLPENNPWYAEVTADLQAHAAPGDVVIVQAPWHYQALLAHTPDLPWRLFEIHEEARWREVLDTRSVVWFLGVPAYRGDWDRVERALAGWIRDPVQEWPPPADAALIRYVPPPAAPAWRPLRARFAEGLRLEAVALDPEGPPGILRVGLRVGAAGPTARPYTLFIHLLDPAGRWVAGSDGEPPVPTTAWPPGTSLTIWRALEIPAGLPTGSYRVTAGWYPTGSGGWPRLPTVEGADVAPLGTIVLSPRPSLPGRPWGHRCGPFQLEAVAIARLVPYRQEGPDIRPEPGRPDRLRASIQVTFSEPGTPPVAISIETDAGAYTLSWVAPPAPDQTYPPGSAARWIYEGELPPDRQTRALRVECSGGEARIPAWTAPRRRWSWNYSWMFWNRMPW